MSEYVVMLSYLSDKLDMRLFPHGPQGPCSTATTLWIDSLDTDGVASQHCFIPYVVRRYPVEVRGWSSPSLSTNDMRSIYCGGLLPV